jgi:hypothetical protein
MEPMEMLRAILPLSLVLLGASCSSGATPSSTDDGGVSDVAAEVPAQIDSGGNSDSSPSTDGTTTADSWANYAAGFFTTYCTSCHNPQDATGRDYNIQANVAKDKTAMRCGVAAAQDPSWNCAASPVAKQFPIGSGPKPTDAERARMVAWISAGEP